MTKYFVITKAGIVAFFAALLFSFVFVGLTHAQENPEDAAKKYGVTFPVVELGGCTDIASCRTYCEDPINAETCVSFAKSKGFYKEDDFKTKKDEIIAKAKASLGCDSETSCMNFCEVPANFEKCSSFARTSNLVGGVIARPSETSIISKAREVLGCTSGESCKSFCEQDENRQKCAEFAKQTGLRGGEQRVGPGGCTSEATCKAFCSSPDNFQVCSGFTQTAGGNFSGPGGCNSEESCRTYCQQNSNACNSGGPGRGGPGSSSQGRYNPAEMCNRTPNCSWNGSGCECGFYGETRESQNKAKEYANYCQSNPDKCKVGPGGYPVPEERLRSFSGGTEGNFQDYGDYCKRNPERCKSYSEGPGYIRIDDPAAACSRYGCTWNGSSCQCSGIQNPGPGGNGNDSAARGCASAGGTWKGSYCEMPKDAPFRGDADAASRGCASAGGTWMGNYCKMPSGSSIGPESYYSGGKPGGPGAPYPGKSSSGGGAYGGGYDASGKYVGGSYGGYDSAGNYVGTGTSGGSSGGSGGQYNTGNPSTSCSSAGGTWTGSYCQMPNSGSSGGSYSQSSSGMSRESQEAGCRSCNGSCNWSGDSCNCQCGSSGSTTPPPPAPNPPPPSGDSGSTTAPATQPAPPPPPADSGSTTPPPPPAGQTQGVSATSLLQILVNFLRGN